MALLLGGAPRAEEAPAPRAMTLEDALAYALAHQPSLAAAEARIAAASRDAEIPRAQYLPKVAANAQLVFGTANNTTASYAGTPGLDLVRIGGTKAYAPLEFAPSPSTLAAVGARQEIFDFGRVAAQSAAADAQVELERDREATEKLDLAVTVADAFFAVNGAKSVLEAANQALGRAKALRDTVSAQVQAGTRRPLDLARAEAEVARMEANLARGKGALASAEAVFASAVGVEDPLLDAANGPANAASVPKLEEALSAASAHDPLVAELTAKVKAQELRTRAIAAETRPDLSATAAASVRAGGAEVAGVDGPTGAGFLPSVPNWDAGVVLSWPLLDRTVSMRVASSQELERVRRAELDAARRAVIARVQQAWYADASARASLDALEHSARAAKAAEQQASARFEAGFSTELEVVEASGLRAEAEIQLAIGRFESARARARLARAMGEMPQ